MRCYFYHCWFSLFFRYLVCGVWAGKLFCLVMIVGYLFWQLLEIWQVSIGVGCVWHFHYDYILVTALFVYFSYYPADDIGNHEDEILENAQWYQWRVLVYHEVMLCSLIWNAGEYWRCFSLPRSYVLLTNLKCRRILTLKKDNY